MTYSVGGTIAATDYNGFVGTTAVNVAYANDAAAQNKVAALIGVGYGTRGYGQTATTLASTTAGVIVPAIQWNNLRSAMSTINTHTGAALTLQPVVAAGDTILAEDGTLGRTNISTLISSLDTARNTAAIAQMTVSSVLTSTRTTAWGTIIRHEFTVTFTDENSARYFFNTAGEVRFSGSRTGGSSTTNNAAWTALLAAVGTVKFGASTTTYTGSGGTITNNVGYYGLTGTYQQLFIRTGASSISYYIQARRESYVGANGGNGSVLRFVVTFNDDSVYYYYGSTVDGTIVSQIDQYKAGGVLTIASPTYATVVNL
jgi:hypothetical protein